MGGSSSPLIWGNGIKLNAKSSIPQKEKANPVPKPPGRIGRPANPAKRNGKPVEENSKMPATQRIRPKANKPIETERNLTGRGAFGSAVGVGGGGGV
jgi:hypothetical protein